MHGVCWQRHRAAGDPVSKGRFHQATQPAAGQPCLGGPPGHLGLLSHDGPLQLLQEVGTSGR